MEMLKTNRHLGSAIILLLIFTVTGCATTSVKKTAPSPLVTNTSSVPEELALDVGIGVFDAGLDLVDEDDFAVFPDVRVAEARYFPNLLMQTMQRSGYWGAIRVMPEDLLNTDILVKSIILVSTGESLKLRVNVSDASGREWYTRDYQNVASKYSYARTSRIKEPFQDVYNHITNDIAAYRSKLSDREVTNLRTISRLKFAQEFSPDAFGGHLQKDKAGNLKVVRLPAESDPMLARIEKIRERDYLFVDTLQDYYNAFENDMEEPYNEWRSQSYDEIVAYNELRKTATRHKIAGVASIIGGIVAASSGSRMTRTAGQVGIYGGAELFKDGVGKKAESQMHLEAMDELGDSLSIDLSESVIELDDSTYTLQGDVSSQYLQWKKILQELYAAETGGINPVDDMNVIKNPENQTTN